MLKKILPALFLISFLTVLIAPVVVSAVEEPGEMAGTCTLTHDFGGWEKVRCPASGACDFDNPTYDCPMCCAMNAIYSVTDWIFIGVLAFVVIFILIGAFTMMTAAGSPEKVTSGRNYIIWAMVGAIVAALAKSIPSIVKAILQIS